MSKEQKSPRELGYMLIDASKLDKINKLFVGDRKIDEEENTCPICALGHPVTIGTNK